MPRSPPPSLSQVGHQPGEIFKSVEGHHRSHPLAEWGKAAVHEELRAVPGQVWVGDADRHGHSGRGEAQGRGQTSEGAGHQFVGVELSSSASKRSLQNWHIQLDRQKPGGHQEPTLFFPKGFQKRQPLCKRAPRHSPSPACSRGPARSPSCPHMLSDRKLVAKPKGSERGS